MFDALPAPVWAVLTVDTLLQARQILYGEYVTTLSFQIAERGRREQEFRAALGDPKLAKEIDMIRRYPTSVKEAGRLQKLLKREGIRIRMDMIGVRHPRRSALRLGDLLIEAAVDHGAGWFEMVPAAKQAEKRVRVSDKGRAYINNRDEALALMRPLRLPMLVPPLECTG